MRRAIALGVLFVAGLPTAPAAAAGTSVTQVDATWDVRQVGPHQRSLDLLWQGCGCDTLARTHATVTETAAAVSIVVRKDVNPTEIACPAIAFTAPLTVKLAHPLRGRVIRGRPKTPASAWLIPQPARPDGRRFVPRLAGFAPRDARRALAIVADPAIFVTTHHHGGRRRVVRQSPAPGYTLKADGTVKVTLDGGRPSGAKHSVLRVTAAASRACRSFTASGLDTRIRVYAHRGVPCRTAHRVMYKLFHGSSHMIEGWHCIGPQTGYASCTRHGHQVTASF